MISLRVVIPFRNFCGSKWKSNAKRLTSFSTCSSFSSLLPAPFSRLFSSCTCLTRLRGWAYRPNHERNTSNHVSGSIFKKVTVTKIPGTFEVTRDSRDFSSIDIHGTVSTGEKKKKKSLSNRGPVSSIIEIVMASAGRASRGAAVPWDEIRAL